MGEVDSGFIQNVEHRPKPTIIEGEGLGIPMIDLSVPNSPDAKARLVAEISDACKNWGFFQVINHGVPLESPQGIEKAAREFFALSKEEKLKVKRDDVNPLGYYDTEYTKNVRDWKEVFDCIIDQDPIVLPASPDPDDRELIELTNQWPACRPGLREVCEEYAQELTKLSYKLLELISLSLGLEAHRLSCFFKDKQFNFIRLNYYPTCPAPHLALGLGGHKDTGALTILAQDDVGGLEVKRKTDGEWVRVKPTPDAYIVNLGDIIQVWSNGKYESVEHRVVVNSEKERFSFPFFFFPAHYTMVDPLEELIDEQNPAKYKAYNIGKFLATRLRSNYKKLDVENLQIKHFEI